MGAHMNPLEEQKLMMTRRHFFGRLSLGVGAAALASLLGESGYAQSGDAKAGLPDLPHFAPKAKRVIYLYQAGGPSQLDLFDHKPRLENLRGQNLPESIRMGQRLTGMTAHQSNWFGQVLPAQVLKPRFMIEEVELRRAAGLV